MIAKTFKEAGLLHTDMACCQFMPNDFSKKGKLKLTEEAKLGEELLIMFDEEDIKKQKSE